MPVSTGLGVSRAVRNRPDPFQANDREPSKNSQKGNTNMNGTSLPGQREEWIAHLTAIAYHAILRRGFRGSFLDLELSIWQDVRRIVDQTWPSAA